MPGSRSAALYRQAAVGRTNQLREDQAIYYGLVKPREAKHAADLYHTYQK
jgi:hypothetical protein